MQTAPMRILGAGLKIELVRCRRVFYRSARLGDPTGAHAAQSGGLIRFVPGSTDSALLVASRSWFDRPTDP